ncbi:MAG: glycosyltransferase family 39 protein [Archangium sp.]
MTRLHAGVLVFAAALLTFECVRHTDDSDAELYTVVARHMVEDGTWTNLRYLENVHPQYREHLPFGLWPSALTIRIAGERALPFVSALWTLLTIALVIELGRKLISLEVGLLAGLALATTERFIAFGAMHRLDPPLIFFSLLACAPLIFERRDARGFAVMSAAAALAVLIKGPFGLVLPVAMTLGVAGARRDLKWLAFGAVACLAAVLPLAAFLALADSSWRDGYLQHQLLASATASRTDGDTSPLATFIAIGALCWPWLPFAIPWRRTFDLRVVIATAATLLFLALAGRKLPHHVLLSFPFIVLLAAHNLSQWPPKVLRVLVVLAVIGGPIAAALNPAPRAIACTQFASQLSALPVGTHVTVLGSTDGRHWRELATLAAEFKLQPWLAATRADAHPATALILENVDGQWTLSPPP